MTLEIWLEPEVKRRMLAYAKLCKVEISGFGEVSIVDGSLNVDNIFILKQSATLGNTDLDDDAMQTLLYEMMQEDIDPAKLGLWWHSHAGAQTFFSTTDEATIDRFGEMGREWMASIVTNHNGNLLGRLDYYHPVHAHADLEVCSYEEIDEPFEASIKEEIEEKVSIPKSSPPRTGWTPRFDWELGAADPALLGGRPMVRHKADNGTILLLPPGMKCGHKHCEEDEAESCCADLPQAGQYTTCCKAEMGGD